MGTPKSNILIGFSIINQPAIGVITMTTETSICRSFSTPCSWLSRVVSTLFEQNGSQLNTFLRVFSPSFQDLLPAFSMAFPMVFPFLHDFPMVFPGVSHGFPMVFPRGRRRAPRGATLGGSNAPRRAPRAPCSGFPSSWRRGGG